MCIWADVVAMNYTGNTGGEGLRVGFSAFSSRPLRGLWDASANLQDRQLCGN